jgi:translation initiation factor 1 (eIF-1/SUI1)
LYFRVIVSEREFKRHEQYFLKTIDERKSLEYKLKHWPKIILGRDLIFTSGIGKSFVDLKNLRNSLMHFVSSHETVKVPNIEIQGLANIDHFEKLSIEDARNALVVAEDFLCEIFRLRGINETDFNYMLRLWSAKAPA